MSSALAPNSDDLAGHYHRHGAHGLEDGHGKRAVCASRPRHHRRLDCLRGPDGVHRPGGLPAHLWKEELRFPGELVEAAFRRASKEAFRNAQALAISLDRHSWRRVDKCRRPKSTEFTTARLNKTPSGREPPTAADPHSGGSEGDRAQEPSPGVGRATDGLGVLSGGEGSAFRVFS